MNMASKSPSAATTATTTRPVAKKIKLFQLTKQYYHDVGILPSQLQSDRHFNWKNVLIFCSCVVYFISILLYFFFAAKSMKELATTFYTFTGVLLTIFFNAILIYERDYIFRMIENAEDFIEKNSQSTAAQIKYNAVNRKIEKMSKSIYDILIKVNVPMVFLPTAIICMINYYICDLGEESFELTCPLMTPFSWKNPFGFISVMIFETVVDLIQLAIVVPIINFFIGSCWLFICILKVSPILKGNAAHDTELKKDFFKMVQFYFDTKQLVNDFNAIYKLVWLVFFLWALTNIASGLLVIEAESLDLMTAIPTMAVGVTLFSVIFIICEFGESVTAQFERYDRRLCNYKWYSFMIEMQKNVFDFCCKYTTIDGNKKLWEHRSYTRNS